TRAGRRLIPRPQSLACSSSSPSIALPHWRRPVGFSGGVDNDSPECHEAGFVPILAIAPPPLVTRRKTTATPAFLAVEVEHGMRVSIDDQDGLATRRRPTDLVLGSAISILYASHVIDVKRIEYGPVDCLAGIEIPGLAVVLKDDGGFAVLRLRTE